MKKPVKKRTNKSPVEEVPFFLDKTAFLESEEFFNLLQWYRHAPLNPQKAVTEAFEEIKTYIREHIKE